MPSEPGLAEIHRDLLKLLKCFHRLCTDNGITYSLHGGTLLGAVREKGFIPWDDDIDVAMMQREYQRFRTLVNEGKLPSGLIFDDKHRVVRIWLEKDGRPSVCLDIFIYDYISSNRLLIELKWFISMVLRMLMVGKTELKRYRLTHTHGAWMYYVCDLLRMIGSAFPKGRVLELFRWFNRNCLCGDRTMICRCNDVWATRKCVHPATIMDEFLAVPFEDTELMIHKRYREVLITTYGDDYMTPKRIDMKAKIHSMTRSLGGPDSE